MLSLQALLALSLATFVRGHGVILNAQGIDGSPNSVGFQVDPAIARNCTTINPCQQDATIIRDAEISANVVNECGRTELSGNIDVGENTENALSAKQVTQVKSGSKITVTIHQVNADGAGPYACDLDETSNTGTITQNLTVTNNVPGVNGFSQAKAQSFNITVQMPDKFTCTGASTGNVCTVRCRNNALAGPFGGCFAVQQVDTDEKTNVANSIQTEQSLDDVLNQVQQNQADFEVAVDANKNAGSDEGEQNLAAVNAILHNTIVTRSFAQQTPTVVQGGNQATVSQGNSVATSAAEDVATTTSANATPPAIATTAGEEIITTAITPTTAQTTDAAQGQNGGNNNVQNGNNGRNGNNRGGRNRGGNQNQNQDNGNQNNGNQNNANQNQNNGNNNSFGGPGNGNFGRAIRGLRWARRIVSFDS